jgi:hypothetical protein
MRDDTPRVLKVLDALSQLLNVLVWPGHRDTTSNESLSGRAYRQGLWIEPVINAMFPRQRNPRHCQQAYLTDLERARQYIETQSGDEI